MPWKSALVICSVCGHEQWSAYPVGLEGVLYEDRLQCGSCGAMACAPADGSRYNPDQQEFFK